MHLISGFSTKDIKLTWFVFLSYMEASALRYLGVDHFGRNRTKFAKCKKSNAVINFSCLISWLGFVFVLSIGYFTPLLAFPFLIPMKIFREAYTTKNNF